MKKILFMLLFTFGALTQSMAGGNGEPKVLNIQVLDDDGSPIVGAKVLVEGSEKAIYTDFEGEFVLPFTSDKSQKVTVSMASYTDNTSVINAQNSMKSGVSIILYSK